MNLCMNCGQVSQPFGSTFFEVTQTLYGAFTLPDSDKVSDSDITVHSNGIKIEVELKSNSMNAP